MIGTFLALSSFGLNYVGWIPWWIIVPWGSEKLRWTKAIGLSMVIASIGIVIDTM